MFHFATQEEEREKERERRRNDVRERDRERARKEHVREWDKDKLRQSKSPSPQRSREKDRDKERRRSLGDRGGRDRSRERDRDRRRSRERRERKGAKVCPDFKIGNEEIPTMRPQICLLSRASYEMFYVTHAEKKVEDDEPPAKLLDDLFCKTKVTPCIYWLPLTEEQVILFLQRITIRDFYGRLSFEHDNVDYNYSN